MERAGGPSGVMNRTTEAVFVLGSGGVAGFGVLLVNLAREETWPAPALTAFLVLVLAFGLLSAALQVWARDATTVLIPAASILAAVGFVTIYRLDEDLASLHGWWLLLSAAMSVLWLYAVSGKPLGHGGGGWWPLVAALTVLVLIPTLGAGGDPTWLAWSSGATVVLNPGELVKVAAVALFAVFLSERQAAVSTGGWDTLSLRTAWTAIGWSSLVPIALVLIGLAFRDFATCMVVTAVFSVMAYLSTDRAWYLAGGLGTGCLGLAASVWLSDGFTTQLSAWMDPWTQPDGPGSRLAQGLFGLGAGSLSGTGLGLGSPDLIPESTTSLVLSAIGEELGLAGTVVVLAAYALVVATGLGIALRARKVFHKLLAGGLSLLLGAETALSVAGVVRLLPGTAQPIPFLSYGLSLTMAGFLIVAVLARISHEERP